jgi:GT2 family glycosyltransferase
VLRKHPDFLAGRHLAPSALVVALGGFAAASSLVPAAQAALALVAAAWGVVLVAAACTARGAAWRERLLLPCAVGGMHLAYGAGLLREAAKHGPSPRPRSCTTRVETQPSRGATVERTERYQAATLSVVICTKDRPEMLATCLDSLECQTRRPEEILIVDASSVPARDAVERLVRKWPDCLVVSIAAAPGLPRQRNIGARAATGSLVVYLDDDVVLEPGYLAAIARTFEADAPKQIGGAGGAQIPDPTPREGFLRRAACRLFLLETYGRGIVKRSGYPDYVFSPRSRMEVEFLSGCNMAYRREVLDALSFDERLSGYALGEDLQFSYRVSRRWKLVLVPDARLQHRHAGGGRPVGDDHQAMAVYNRYLFFREHVARGVFDWVAYAWSSIGAMLLNLRDPNTRGVRGATAGYRAVFRHLRRRQPAAIPTSEPLVDGSRSY